MICNIYWRDSFGALHNIGVDGASSIKDAFQAVLEQLNESMEIYRKPLLCLIKGGKTK